MDCDPEVSLAKLAISSPSQTQSAGSVQDGRGATNPHDFQPYSLLLVNKQIHAEAAWLLPAVNTIHFPSLASTECFRRGRKHHRRRPLPPDSSPDTWRKASIIHAISDPIGLSNIMLDLWTLGQITETTHFDAPYHLPTEAQALARTVGHFPRLHTVNLRINLAAPGQLCMFARLVEETQKTQVKRWELEEVFVKDALSGAEARRRRGERDSLRVCFYGLGHLRGVSSKGVEYTVKEPEGGWRIDQVRAFGSRWRRQYWYKR